MGLSMLSVVQIMRGLKRSSRRVAARIDGFTSFGPMGLRKFDFPWAGFHVTSKIEPPPLFYWGLMLIISYFVVLDVCQTFGFLTILLDNETPRHKFVGPFEIGPNKSCFCWAFLLEPSQIWPMRFLSCKGLLCQIPIWRCEFGILAILSPPSFSPFVQKDRSLSVLCRPPPSIRRSFSSLFTLHLHPPLHQT